MRRDDPTTPFDVEADEAADLTQQFWGASRGWIDGPTGEHRVDAVDRTGSLQALREGLTVFRPRRVDTTDRINRVGRTRQHGVFRPGSVREASLGELASSAMFSDDDDPMHGHDPRASERDDLIHAEPHDRVDTEPRAALRGVDHRLDTVPLADRLGVGAIDPLLARLGIMLLIGALMVPIALALRPNTADGAIQTQPASGSAAPAGEVPAEVDAPDDELPESSVLAESVGTPDSTSASPAAVRPTPTPDAPTAASSETTESNDIDSDERATSSVGDVPQEQPGTTAGSEVATVSAAAERLMPECPMTHTAGAGDSWYRIADAAGVSASALLDENRADVDTPIFPGDEICLPADATVPSPTAAPATTTPATTAPTATAAPTTTTPPPSAPASPSAVRQIIRDVWPDELEDKALDIADRESRFDATAYNGWCCYGVFQLYWSVHQSWLDDYGILSVNDLYDARKNVEAAYALYQRSGGWGPWGG